MLLTTTPNVDGKDVSQYHGIVTGEAILGANIFRDVFARVRDVVGGRSAGYEKALAEARQTALDEMSEGARRLGGNAVIGIDLDYEVVGAGMLMVAATGTAVTV